MEEDKSPKQQQTDSIKEKIKDFPQTSGVYLMKNEKSIVIYVGKAKNLRSRVKSYFLNSQDKPVKTTYLVSKIQHIDYILTDTEVEAFLLEASLIKKYKPRYNIRLKDDKAYPYIKCTMGHMFPRFEVSRKVIRDQSIYFGPYTSGFAVKETIEFINKTFLIRDCKDSVMKSRKRPCLTYDIGRCKAPCVGLVSREEYLNDLNSALEFLKGESELTAKTLEKRMKQAANEERFEQAARYRDALSSVQRIWEKQSVIKANEHIDKDAFVFVGDARGTLIESVHSRNGRIIGNRYHFIPRLNPDSPTEEIKEWLTSYLNQYYNDNFIPDEIYLTVDLGHDIIKLLKGVFYELQGKRPNIVHITSGEENALINIAYKNAHSHFQTQMNRQQSRQSGLVEIQQRFALEKLPMRIECFDISNFQGEYSVASQVVFEEGMPKKSDYRRYKIKSVEGANDYASMKEVITRRLEHKEYDDPDLILVDGGKGQLKMALEVLKELKRIDIPVVGLAKARAQGEFQDTQVEHTEERFFIPGRQNYITLKPNSEAFQILVGLRDEAHRFAITYHRKLRGEGSIKSMLEDIPGLGKKRILALLSHFTGVDDIKKASVQELSEVEGISEKLAEQILTSLKEK